MIICPECSTEYEKEAKYCFKCRIPFVDDIPENISKYLRRGPSLNNLQGPTTGGTKSNSLNSGVVSNTEQKPPLQRNVSLPTISSKPTITTPLNNNNNVSLINLSTATQPNSTTTSSNPSFSNIQISSSAQPSSHISPPTTSVNNISSPNTNTNNNNSINNNINSLNGNRPRLQSTPTPPSHPLPPVPPSTLNRMSVPPQSVTSPTSRNPPPPPISSSTSTANLKNPTTTTTPPTTTSPSPPPTSTSTNNRANSPINTTTSPMTDFTSISSPHLEEQQDPIKQQPPPQPHHVPISKRPLSKRIPPPPPSKKIVRAIWDCVPEQEGDLSFKVGDIISVISKDDESSWWLGSCNGRTGLFPSNYVREYDA
eukprot:gene7839-9653_t